MEFIDTHAHLYLEQFEFDFEEVVQRCKENHVNTILLPNIDRKSVEQVQRLCVKDPKMFKAMMGLHPCAVLDNYEQELEYIFNVKHLNNICAIGEIGLDYYWSKEYKEQQIEAFQLQIEFAKEKKMPIAVHCRNAFDDVLDILESKCDHNLKGVLHCFSGNIEQAQRLIAMGFYLGIGGVLTYKNSGLDKVLAEINVKHLILETDAPYLSPVPYRGKRNESSYIQYIAKKLAAIKNMNLEEISTITSSNAKLLFDL